MTVRRASTVCVVREAGGGLEVLLARRPASAVFVPGAYVFPGGAVDPCDDRAAREWGVDAWILAAIRETYEEVGLLIGVTAPEHTELDRVDPDAFYAGLRHSGATVRPESMTYVSTWVTPPGPPRRFDTRFYLAEAPQGGESVVDGEELVESVWITPRAAIAAAEAGDMMVITPTLAHLDYLAGYGSFVAARLAALAGAHADTVDQFIIEGFRAEGHG